MTRTVDFVLDSAVRVIKVLVRQRHHMRVQKWHSVFIVHADVTAAVLGACEKLSVCFKEIRGRVEVRERDTREIAEYRLRSRCLHCKLVVRSQPLLEFGGGAELALLAADEQWFVDVLTRFGCLVGRLRRAGREQ